MDKLTFENKLNTISDNYYEKSHRYLRNLYKRHPEDDKFLEWIFELDQPIVNEHDAYQRYLNAHLENSKVGNPEVVYTNETRKKLYSISCPEVDEVDFSVEVFRSDIEDANEAYLEDEQKTDLKHPQSVLEYVK